MKKADAYVGQPVIYGDDGTRFTITEIDDDGLGARISNDEEETWIELEYLEPDPKSPAGKMVSFDEYRDKKARECITKNILENTKSF
jgi:hypothetical protein